MLTKGIHKVLVTGGAGFIGSHTVDLLVEEGYQTVVLDALVTQVHGTSSRKPSYLNTQARFVKGDVRDKNLLKPILKEVDAVMHLASSVGVGQSMYQIEQYIDANTRGTATLLDLLANEDHSIHKLIVASSMSIYGEGKYRCERCGKDKYPGLRSPETLKAKRWEHLCEECGFPLTPKPTDEDKPPKPTSIYAMSKRHQEETSLLIGRTYGIPAIALRYFNVYGPRQSLSNPYTGACAIFISRMLNGKPPYIFEDGNQTRDFINVRDVARANILALKSGRSGAYQAINIGTGKPTSILHLASTLTHLLNPSIQPLISNTYRLGDIRHGYADTSKAEQLLGFKTTISLRKGLNQLIQWAIKNKWAAKDRFEESLQELKSKGLVNQA